MSALSRIHLRTHRLLGLQASLRIRRTAFLLKFDVNQPRDESGRWVGSGDDEPKDGGSFARILATARGRRGLEAECKAQYDRDIFHCNIVGLPGCYAQAMVRRVACERGYPIPPLNY